MAKKEKLKTTKKIKTPKTEKESGGVRRRFENAYSGEKKNRNLIITVSVIIVALVSGVFIFQSTVNLESDIEADEVNVTLYDFATGKDVTDDIDVTVYWLEEKVALDKDFDTEDLYDKDNFEKLDTEKANKIDVDLTKDNRSSCWIKIDDNDYAEDWHLISFNGNYSIDVFKISDDLPFNVIDPDTFATFKNKADNEWKLIFNILDDDECQAPIYKLEDDELKDKFPKEKLGQNTEFLAFKFHFNGTITESDIELDVDDDNIETEIIYDFDNNVIYIVVVEAVSDDYDLDFIFDLEQSLIEGNKLTDIGVDEISSIRLIVPQDDEDNISVDKIYKSITILA